AQASTNEQKAVANEQKAAANAAAAQEKEQEATKQRDEVKVVTEQLLRTVYAPNMNLAKIAWDQHAVGQVRALLNQRRPKPSEPDLRGFEWHFLNRLCHPEARRKIIDAGENITFSPDGKSLFTSHGGGAYFGVPYDPQITRWDTESGRQLFTLKAGGSFHRVIFSPDGKRFASASNEVGGVKIWDASTGEEFLTLKGHTGRVTAVAFSPDGKRLTSGSRAEGDKLGQLKIWDATTGQELRSLQGDFQRVAYNPNGESLAYSTLGATNEVQRLGRSVNVL